jgi:rhodanese-related sulfurtransferase
MPLGKVWKPLFIAALIIIFILPPVLDWALIGRAPTVSSDQAKKLLAAPDTPYSLVDLRAPADFAAGNITGSFNWPYAQIASLSAKTDLPEPLRDKPLLLICYSGISSARAALKLRGLGVDKVLTVHGGMAEWTAVSKQPCPLALGRLRTESGDLRDFPARPSSLIEQWAVSATAFAVKPLYMFGSFVLIVLLWRRDAPDLRALRLAMIGFLLGEGFCAGNYLIFNEGSYLFEYLHQAGMALAFGATAYALMLAVDERVVHYGPESKRCALLPQCGQCVKLAAVPCAVRRLYLIAAAALLVCVFIPLTAGFHHESYNTEILGTPYTYIHPVVFQIYEIRYAPIMALVFFLGALLAWPLRKSDPLPAAQPLLAAGLGLFGFSLFRLVLFQLYRDDLAWFLVWEELTELIYVLGAAAVLWIFRERLFKA